MTDQRKSKLGRNCELARAVGLCISCIVIDRSWMYELMTRLALFIVSLSVTRRLNPTVNAASQLYVFCCSLYISTESILQPPWPVVPIRVLHCLSRLI